MLYNSCSNTQRLNRLMGLIPLSTMLFISKIITTYWEAPL